MNSDTFIGIYMGAGAMFAAMNIGFADDKELPVVLSPLIMMIWPLALAYWFGLYLKSRI